jgi:hypothetical protein
MEMVDLRSERKNQQPTAIAEPDMEYPYGLRIELCEDTIQKLGLDKLPVPGAMVKGGFVARVESASIRKDKESQARSVCIQIVKMGIGSGKEKDDSDRMAKPKMIPNKPEKDGPSAEKVLYSD